MQPNKAAAETLFNLDEKKKIILNKDSLHQILLQDDIKDKNVCVISIAGAFRQGKSFLLNFFVRYLNMKYKEKKNLSKWLDGPNEAVSGFSWQAGWKRHTVGILMWSEIFLTRLSSGEELAIILLDTQGSFDVVSTITECATIFALSTLISSVQIYNLKENIKQCDLGHLEYFVNYGQMVHDKSQDGGPPFQNLVFLVRDWQWKCDHKFGFKGGEELLEQILNINCADVPVEILEQRRNIKKMFEDISCFLLPHPGEVVATDPKFKGELHKIAPKFKKHMGNLVPHILDSDNLVPKTINGKKITVTELVHLIETYWECFASGKLPQLSTLLSASSKLQHILSINEAENKYDESMKFKVGDEESVFNDEALKNLHDDSKNLAMSHYCSTKKMGDEGTSEQYKTLLEKKLETKFLGYKEMNELKRKNQAGIINWISYMWSKKWIVGPVYSVISPVTTAAAGYIGFTNSVAAAGVAAEVITATVAYGTLGLAVGSVIIAPLAIAGLAVGGWMLWSKKRSKKNTNPTTDHTNEESIPLIEKL